MQYLVTGEYVEPGPLFAPEPLVSFVEQQVIPSLEMIAKWERDGKVKGGGVFAGQRMGCFVLEVASHEELGQLLASLPFWGTMKWDVKPLQSWSSTAQREKGLVAQIKVGS